MGSHGRRGPASAAGKLTGEAPAAYRGPVHRRRLLLAVAASFTVATAAAVIALGGAGADRDASVDAAAALLSPRFAAAPELRDVDARGALSRLEGVGDDPEVLGLRGLARALDGLRRGEASLARRGCDDARRFLPASPLLRVLDAEIAALEGDAERAGVALADAAARYPDDPRVQLALADRALDRQDGAGALERLEPLADRFPGLASVQNRRGLALELRGATAAARAAWTLAADLDRRSPEARINLGRAHLAAGELERAVRRFGEALTIDPTHADALFGRALAHLRRGDLAAARRDLREAAALSPEDPGIRLAMGDLARREDDPEEALRAYREAVALDPESEAGWVRLGNALFRGGDLDGARDAYERALAVDPGLPAANRGLAVLARLR